MDLAVALAAEHWPETDPDADWQQIKGQGKKRWKIYVMLVEFRIFRIKKNDGT